MKHVLNCSGHELKIPDIVDSDGIYVLDDAGKRYMDLESGVWCTSVGHKNESINRVINHQIESLMHAGFCYSSKVVDEAAKDVLSVTGLKGGKCVFLCSGSEAIEIIRQMSKHLMGTQKTLTLHDAYLGSYSVVTNRNAGWYSFNWETCETCPQRETCDVDCEKLQQIPRDITEFIFEPGSASGFVKFPPKAMIQNIVNLVRNNGGKIIANDVTTGTGRTGRWFGYQHYDITPDMIAVGKGIGNGYPVSVAVLGESIVRELENQSFKYGQSHQNDPLGAAVVREVIKVIKKNDLINDAAVKGEVFLSRLKALVDGKVVLAVRGKGLMFGIDLGSPEIGDEIYNELIGKGYIVCNRSALFRIDPPLAITEAEFFEFVSAFKNLVAKKK